MIIKAVYVRDVAIIEIDLEPCADAFIFRIRNNEIELCSKSLVLSETLANFRKGLLIMRKQPFFVECEDGKCVAARAQI
ncbi:MAG: hypothetical protein QXK11_04440 [Pyrobaculum sp.]|uniref:Uncharacterized protein n=2 Tax=Pyrobaculum arsenaticum TaxID=121277 RepID=A4WL83_PYRAR|nr:conserved hypothetical protein [Pyrobaculum arsenaticum DSM 13514]NYR15126.1 hypothetical protein [Pyrobaculum arsenaticum]